MTIETIDKVNYLRTVTIFSDCSPQDLSRVIPSTSEHYFKTDETIFNAGAAANELYIIVEGTVRLTSGGRIIDKVSQGLLGEEAALGQETYLLSCVAQSNTIVLSINKNALKKISISNPDLTNGFYESLINHSLDNQLTKYKPIDPSSNKVSETKIADLTEALRLNPDDADCYYNRTYAKTLYIAHDN